MSTITANNFIYIRQNGFNIEYKKDDDTLYNTII